MSHQDQPAQAPAESLPQVFYLAPAKLRHGLILAAVLTTIGLASIWLAPADLPYAGWLAAVNLLLAAAILLAVWRAAHDRKPRLIISDEGIWYRDWETDTVPWAAIAEAHLQGSRMQVFACIELRAPQAWLAALPEAQRRRCSKNRLFRPPCLLLPNGAIDAPLDRVTALVEEVRNSGCTAAHSS